MKRTNNDMARHLRLRAVVAYPAVSVVLVVALALFLTSFGPSPVMALDAPPTPTETTTSSPATSSSPSPTTVPAPAETTAPSATPTSDPGATPSPAPLPSAVNGVAPVDHHVLARIEGPKLQANYLPVDQPVVDASQFQTFRVRFRLHNAGVDPITATPRLEFRPEGAAGYVVVPEKPLPGIPFHAAREWVPGLGLGGGTMQSELGEDIAVANFRIGEESGLAVTGHRSMGANPDQAITLPTASYSEQEFTVTLSIDAEYLTGYELRITDAGTALTGTDVARIRLGASPAVLLSPGQVQGETVVDPTPASSSAGAAYPLLSAQSIIASTSAVSAAPAVSGPSAVGYPLTVSAVSAAVAGPSAVHGPYSLTTDKCATCHRGHAAKAPTLLASGSQSTLCLTCHGAAAGALTNVEADYTDPLVPVNNPAEREYYSHDAEAASTHTRSELDEFGGQTNRHSSCADCHNSHKAKGADSTQMSDTDVGGGGWSASGRLAGVSGVSVVNGVAGSAPAYTFLSGVPAALPDPTTLIEKYPVVREYQLCFKCHSGFTTLTSNDGLKPSQYAFDKGVEFNPANASFHPVEAAGKNDTAKMTASLAGSSPYKLWNFTTGSTIRCLNCHASGSTEGAAPPLPQPGSSLPAHTSSNRGILLRPYLDRELKPNVDSATVKADYSAGDFALCYVCHGEASFAPNGSSDATNFSFHSKHLTGLKGKGQGGTDIDVAGDGQGNATCAECHFRIHSTTNKVGEPGGSRLVNFSPNVQPVVAGGTPSWTLGANGGGSCTLTCHAKQHDALQYSP